MPKKAIEGCVCGEKGAGSECTYNRHGRCQWCGFNEKVHERRKYLLKHDGLTQFKNGLWGLKLPPWEVIS